MGKIIRLASANDGEGHWMHRNVGGWMGFPPPRRHMCLVDPGIPRVRRFVDHTIGVGEDMRVMCACAVSQGDGSCDAVLWEAPWRE